MNFNMNNIIWVMIAGVYLMNINDLIRGPWFYTGTLSILVWNITALIGAIGLALEMREKKK